MGGYEIDQLNSGSFQVLTKAYTTGISSSEARRILNYQIRVLTDYMELRGSRQRVRNVQGYVYKQADHHCNRKPNPDKSESTLIDVNPYHENRS